MVPLQLRGASARTEAAAVSRAVVLPLRMFCVAVTYVFRKCAKNAFVQRTLLRYHPKYDQKHTQRQHTIGDRPRSKAPREDDESHFSSVVVPLLMFWAYFQGVA